MFEFWLRIIAFLNIQFLFKIDYMPEYLNYHGTFLITLSPKGVYRHGSFDYICHDHTLNFRAT